MNIKMLKEYFEKEQEVSFAFIFGSHADKREHAGSDWDIAVYFRHEGQGIEIEEIPKEYPGEERILADLTRILKTDRIDLIVLNRAPAHLSTSVLRGIPLIIKDQRDYLEFVLAVSREAEDYDNFVDDYYQIYQRSLSLSGEDKTTIEKRVIFLENECRDFSYYRNFTYQDYQNLRKKREVERWVENIINATIDIAKIILASDKNIVPETYREALGKLDSRGEFKKETLQIISRWVSLRNILAHQYLDIRWQKISDFIAKGEAIYEDFLQSVKEILVVSHSENC